MSRPYKASSVVPSRLEDMAVIDIAKENIRKLEEIQRVILVEDEDPTTLDEVLSRVLNFYRNFVPFN
ncbi:MAG: hypothetical protein NWE75_06305 [Candidatus Bathyarchaeota archaeon]|nr:hypothetical protein [Candidatus Bathyarchaeota archaeon]